jgi:hypothetical protein
LFKQEPLYSPAWGGVEDLRYILCEFCITNAKQWWLL